MATISSWLCSREWHSNGNSGVGSIGCWDAFGPNSGLDSSRVNREVSSAGGAEGGGGFAGAVHTDAYAGRLLLATHTPPPPSCSMVSGRAAARELWTAVVRVSSPPVMTMHCGRWVLAIARVNLKGDETNQHAGARGLRELPAVLEELRGWIGHACFFCTRIRPLNKTM